MTERNEGERPTVLVVDDDPRNRALVTAWLGRAYHVVEAADGQAALDRLDQIDPDVVLLDVMMPGLDGIETCRRIKARSGDNYLPVLLLTALGQQSSRNAGLESGADDFLTKPIDQRELHLRVRTFLTIRRQDRVIRGQLAELRKLDQLKNDLIGLVTHDLRNALTGVHVMLESIQYGGGTPTPGQFTTLLGATGRMNMTLEDMLRIRQLEDGALKISLEETPLSAVFEAAVALVQPAASPRGVSIRARGGRNTVVGDRILLERSLYNLLQNAVKFSPKEGEVEIEAVAASGMVTVEVRDRGPGIADDLKSGLFDKYAGLHARRGRGPQGHGLGLFLVQLVAAAHGGRIEAEPREGGGTTFRLTLPVVASGDGT